MKFLSFVLSLLIHAIFIAVFLFIITEYNAVLKEKPRIYSVELVNYKISTKNEHKKKTAKPTIKKKKIPITVHKKPKPKKKPKPVPKKPKPIKLPKQKPHKKPKPKPKKKLLVKHKKKIQHKPKIKHKPKKHVIPKKIIKKKKIVKKQIKKTEKKVNPELQKIKEELYKEKIAALRRKLERERLSSEIAKIRKKIAQEEAEAKQRKENLIRYSTLISNIIHSNWYVDTKLIKHKILITIIKVTLDSKGIITNISIMKSSGNFYFDKTVRDAVLSSEPFPKPPSDLLTNGYVTFILKFDSRQL